jgi:hypothetical protein
MAAQADVVPLLIHGFLDKGAIWKALTDHLGVLAARALAPDCAGAGMRGWRRLVPSPCVGRRRSRELRTR